MRIRHKSPIRQFSWCNMIMKHGSFTQGPSWVHWNAYIFICYRYSPHLLHIDSSELKLIWNLCIDLMKHHTGRLVLHISLVYWSRYHAIAMFWKVWADANLMSDASKHPLDMDRRLDCESKRMRFVWFAIFSFVISASLAAIDVEGGERGALVEGKVGQSLFSLERF